LRRLRTDYVDVLLLHNPPVKLMDGTRAPRYEEMERLKAEGKLRGYGVSLGYSRDLKTVLETTRSGAIEVTFNVFHQEPRAAFRCARERGVGLIVNVPLDSGWLSGKFRGDSRFTGVRRRWSPDVITRRRGSSSRSRHWCRRASRWCIRRFATCWRSRRSRR
jgi:aryl-alcohol dehydrogenase-like predicted oxidoreductase